MQKFWQLDEGCLRKKTQKAKAPPSEINKPQEIFQRKYKNFKKIRR